MKNTCDENDYDEVTYCHLNCQLIPLGSLSRADKIDFPHSAHSDRKPPFALMGAECPPENYVENGLYARTQ